MDVILLKGTANLKLNVILMNAIMLTVIRLNLFLQNVTLPSDFQPNINILKTKINIILMNATRLIVPAPWSTKSKKLLVTDEIRILIPLTSTKLECLSHTDTFTLVLYFRQGQNPLV